MLNDGITDPERESHERLRQRAWDLMSRGILPRAEPHRLYAGYGSDRPCQLCAASISSKEVEYELEFSAADQTSEKFVVRIHAACHLIWDDERKRSW